MIKEAFTPYLNADGLYHNYPTNGGGKVDNAPLFTSEVLFILDQYGEADQAFKDWYISRIRACIWDNQLHRHPYPDHSPNEQDDYTGVMAAILAFNLPIDIPLPLRLFRMVHLVFMAYLIETKKLGRVGAFLTRRINPFFNFLDIVVSLVIVYAAHKPKQDHDNWMLTWLLVQGCKNESILCRLAGIYFIRKFKSRISEGLSEVAGAYFHPHGLHANPYSRYWKTI